MKSLLLIFGLFSSPIAVEGSDLNLNDLGDDTYKVSANFEIPASGDVVYSVITDFENMPNFIPGLKESHVTKTDGNLVYVSQVKDVHYLIFHRKVLMDLVVEKHPETFSIKFEDTFHDETERYYGSWQVESKDEISKIHYEVTFKLKSDVPHFVVRGVFHKESKNLMLQIQNEILKREQAKLTEKVLKILMKVLKEHEIKK